MSLSSKLVHCEGCRGAQADCGSEDLYPELTSLLMSIGSASQHWGPPSPHPIPSTQSVIKFICAVSRCRQGLTPPLPAPPLLPSSLSTHLSGTRFSISPSLQ